MESAGCVEAHPNSALGPVAVAGTADDDNLNAEAQRSSFP